MFNLFAAPDGPYYCVTGLVCALDPTSAKPGATWQSAPWLLVKCMTVDNKGSCYRPTARPMFNVLASTADSGDGFLQTHEAVDSWDASYPTHAELLVNATQRYILLCNNFFTSTCPTRQSLVKFKALRVNHVKEAREAQDKSQAKANEEKALQRHKVMQKVVETKRKKCHHEQEEEEHDQGQHHPQGGGHGGKGTKRKPEPSSQAHPGSSKKAKSTPKGKKKAASSALPASPPAAGDSSSHEGGGTMTHVTLGSVMLAMTQMTNAVLANTKVSEAAVTKRIASMQDALTTHVTTSLPREAQGKNQKAAGGRPTKNSAPGTGNSKELERVATELKQHVTSQIKGAEARIALQIKQEVEEQLADVKTQLNHQMTAQTERIRVWLTAMTHNLREENERTSAAAVQATSSLFLTQFRSTAAGGQANDGTGGRRQDFLLQ